MTIYKYPLLGLGDQRVAINGLVKLLCVQTQFNAPMLWALVDSSSSDVTEIRLLTYGTGHSITRAGDEYLGTYQIHGGSLVFHVFVAGE